jgi:flagellar basal-body rod protein FlgB
LRGKNAMLETMFQRGSIPALEALMQFTNARHRTIANNIANVETVGYKAQDVDVQGFEKALARAFEASHDPEQGGFPMPSSRNLESSGGGLQFRTVESKEVGILRHIENNVDLDVEMGKLAKNGDLHNLAATILSQQFSMLREAIAERVSG